MGEGAKDGVTVQRPVKETCLTIVQLPTGAILYSQACTCVVWKGDTSTLVGAQAEVLLDSLRSVAYLAVELWPRDGA